MGEYAPHIETRRTIHNLSLGPELAFAAGLGETREALAARDATGGLAALPLDSLFQLELEIAGLLGRFVNEEDGVRLVGSLEQPFAPPIPEAIQRFRDRAGVMPLPERLRRLGSNLVQRYAMLPPLDSLGQLRRMAYIVNEDDLVANMYTEVLPDAAAYPDMGYIRRAKITPDMVRALGGTMDELPRLLAGRNVTELSFDPYAASREPLSGGEALTSWEVWLPAYVAAGLVTQLGLSINRKDTPIDTDIGPNYWTHQIGQELARGDPRTSLLGPLPEQIACIAENYPLGQVLEITLYGGLRDFSDGQIRTIYHNVDELFNEAA